MSDDQTKREPVFSSEIAASQQPKVSPEPKVLVDLEAPPDPRPRADAVASATLLSSLEGRLFGRKKKRRVLLSRYSLKEPIGRGGMGVVYRARDPELNRYVAIKLLRTDHDVSDAVRRGSLLREARAVARLSHANIVPVFDVGTYRPSDLGLPELVESNDPRADQEGLFVVMELAQGQTLDAWLKAEPRRLRQILKVFIAAGRGLVAAHRTGIAHRDFKPSNVIVDDEGRTRVLDFGLARWVRSPEGDDDSMSLLRSRSRALRRQAEGNVSLTLAQTGVAVGTPAYMSPEQHAGEHGDERSDQYSFCVALFEALHGERPYTGESLAELYQAKQQPMPRGPRYLPRRLRRVMRRGMAFDPEDRFDDMEQLLQSMTRIIQSRRPLAVGLAITTVATASVVLLVPRSPPDPTECRASTDKLIDDAWNDDTRVQLRELLAPDEQTRHIWDNARENLDSYTSKWRATRERVCDAEMDPAQRKAQLACLERRRLSVMALVSVLQEPGEGAMTSAVESVDGLPLIADCSAFATSTHDLSPNVSASVESTLARAEGLLRARRRLDALNVIEAALDDLPSDAGPGDHARLLQAQGRILTEGSDFDAAEAALRKAWTAAQQAGEPLLTLRVINDLGDVLIEMGRSGEAAGLLQVLQTRIAGAGLPPDIEAKLHVNLAHLQLNEYDFAATIDHLEQAEVLWEQARGGPSTEQSEAITIRAGVLAQSGQVEAALKLLSDLRIREIERLGPEHPHVGWISYKLADCLRLSHRPDLALTHARDAVRILRRGEGDNNVLVSDAVQGVAVAQVMLGQFKQAYDNVLIYLDALQRIHGEVHPGLVDAYILKADAEFKMGRPRQSVSSLEQAQRAVDQLMIPGPVAQATVSLHRAEVLRELWELEEAEREARRAAETLVESKASRSQSIYAVHVLAMVLASAGQNEGSRRQLTRAEGLIEEATLGDDALALANLSHGEVLVELGNFEAAIERLLMAKEHFMKRPSAVPIQQLRVYHLLARANKGLDNTKAAVEAIAEATETAKSFGIQMKATADADLYQARLLWPRDRAAARDSAKRAQRLLVELEAEDEIRRDVDEWFVTHR